MKLYIIRHGETTWNAQYRLQGATDVPLNENGIALAKATGEALKEVPFDLCITSPLKRAKKTAQLLLGERQIPMLEDARIQEISFGEYEGKSCQKGREEFPPEVMDVFFHSPKDYHAPRGGEELADICMRTKEFYQELIHNETYQDATILIASHGCAVRALLQNVYNDTSLDYWHGGCPPNCSVNIVEVIEGQATLLEEDVVYQ